jgi:type IX secretion system PorP/SprF family membrane protein
MRSAKFYIVAFFLVATANLFAQELDHTQYYLNLPGINAGFTGIEDYVDTRFSFRQGWNDFTVKNNYTFASAYGTLNNFARTALTNNTLRLSNPEAFKQIQNEKKLLRKHGVGGMITSRALGPYKATTINANYAYHLPITSKLNMSFGSRIGYSSQRIDFTGYVVRDQVNDAFYQQIMASSQGNSGSFLMDFGYVLYSSKFYAGLSSNGLISTHITGTSLVELEQARRISLQGALTSMRLNSSITFSPAMRLTYAKGYSTILSLNGRFMIKNLVYVGAGYTNSSPKLSLLFGLNLNGRFSVNYSYDKYLSNLNNFNVNVHELVIGAALFNRYNAANRLW